MKGRIRRQQALAEAAAHHAALAQAQALAEVVCPLCDRPIPPPQRDAHHLVPKSRGGVHTVLLHRICHRQLHALLTEEELAREYHHIDALRAHPGVSRFVAWVQAKPPGFHERTRKSVRLRQR